MGQTDDTGSYVAPEHQIPQDVAALYRDQDYEAATSIKDDDDDDNEDEQ